MQESAREEPRVREPRVALGAGPGQGLAEGNRRHLPLVAEPQLGPAASQHEHVAVAQHRLVHALAGQERPRLGAAVAEHDVAVPLEDVGSAGRRSPGPAPAILGRSRRRRAGARRRRRPGAGPDRWTEAQATGQAGQRRQGSGELLDASRAPICARPWTSPNRAQLEEPTRRNTSTRASLNCSWREHRLRVAVVEVVARVGA